jgi:hypothetical protein
MKWSVLKRTIVAGGSGIALAAVMGIVLHPKTYLSDDVVVALVSDQCPIAHEVVESALTFREVRQRVITIPIDDDLGTPSEFRGIACGIAVAHIREEAPWMAAVPRGWLCRQLVYYGARLHQEHFTGTPAYLVDGAPITLDALDEELSASGLRRTRGLIFPKDHPLLPNPEVDAMLFGTVSTVRGSDLGF